MKKKNKIKNDGGQHSSSLALHFLSHKRPWDLQNQKSFLLNASVLWSFHSSMQQTMPAGKAKPYKLKKESPRKKDRCSGQKSVTVDSSGHELQSHLAEQWKAQGINQTGRAVSLGIKSSDMTSARDIAKQADMLAIMLSCWIKPLSVV